MSLLTITSVLVPARCIESTHVHLLECGLRGCEGMALWAGSRSGNAFRVQHAIIPKQRGIRSDHGIAVAVGPEELHRINVWLFQNKVSLVAQIHSHPGAAYHSDTDDSYALVAKEGALSIVVPNFARDGFIIPRCAVYRLSAIGHWTEVSPDAANKLINVVE
jgi:hypothetical protein